MGCGQPSTVAHILSRREYLGCTINFKTYRKSYKCKKQLKNDPSVSTEMQMRFWIGCYDRPRPIVGLSPMIGRGIYVQPGFQSFPLILLSKSTLWNR